jgi:hypothetical protein
MKLNLRAATAIALLIAISGGGAAFAQKQGGILRMYSPDSPASMSILEEATVFAEGPLMGVFNNLVMFDQHVKQNSLSSIVPDLATGWSWNEDGTELTFPLRQGVKWHDGKPFHGGGRQVHLGPDQRPGEREAARQSPQVLIQEPGPGHDKRRLRGHLSSEAAAAGFFDDPRLGVCSDLPVPHTGT